MGIPSIGGYIISEGSTIPATQYKYIPYHARQNVYTHTTATKRKKITPHDIANLVILGGPFEKIGEENESVGGGNQKVGSGI